LGGPEKHVVGRAVTRARRTVGTALAMLALLAPTIERASTREAATANHRSAMTNWASDVATEAVSGRGREPVEASRVVLDVGGGAVVVQWSLSYDAYVSIRSGPGQRYPVAQVRAIAALERGGLEIARWTLGGPGPRSQGHDSGGAGHRDGERPVRRSDIGLPAHDLRPEGLE
jgi:hypothetical protein